MRTLLLVVFLVFGLVAACRSAKEELFTQPAPFEIKSVDSHTENGQLWITVEIKSMDQGVNLEEIHYQNQVAKLIRRDCCNFVAHLDSKPDFIMSDNPLEEAKNRPPHQSQFELGPNETVIGYTQNGKKRYFKFDITADTKVPQP